MIETIQDATAIVKKIIDDALDRKAKLGESQISKWYILGRINMLIHPTALFNSAIEAGVATNNGIENLERGAKCVYRDAMRRLKEYKVDRSGMISRKPTKRDRIKQLADEQGLQLTESDGRFHLWERIEDCKNGFTLDEALRWLNDWGNFIEELAAMNDELIPACEDED